MGLKLGWFAVRSDAELAPVLARVQAKYAATNDVPEAFRIGPRRSAWRTLAARLRGRQSPSWTSAMLVGGRFESAPRWAQAVSLELRCPAIAFFLLEDTWSYAIFDAGEEVLAMESYSVAVPVLYGDAARAASLLGVEVGLFGAYEAGLRAACAADGEEPAPLPGDEHPPHNPWAHADLARRLGVTYPDEGVSDELRLAPAAPREGWSGLLPGLPMPPEPPSEPGGKEIDFDDFPSGDDPF